MIWSLRFNIIKFDQKGMSFLTVLFLLLVLSVAVTTAYIAIEPAFIAGRMSVTQDRLEALKAGIYLYRTHNGGSGPATLDILVTPSLPTCTVDVNEASSTYRQKTGWCGPYIDREIAQDPNSFKTDSWGTLIQYAPTLLRSCGVDRTCGSADDITLNL